MVEGKGTEGAQARWAATELCENKAGDAAA